VKGAQEVLPPIEGAFFLTGPTAGGKTTVGVRLAKLINAEVISLDSMAVYRMMDIGTAKPTVAEREGVPHHLIDIRDPWEEYSLADYLKDAAKVAKQIHGRGKRALFVGGTPLYLKAALCGIFEGPPADPAFRAELASREEAEPGSLHRLLTETAPDDAARLHPNDTRRIIRALEIFRAAGKSIFSFQTQFKTERGASAECRGTILAWERPALGQRINRRVEEMMRHGFLEEVRRLDALPCPLSKTALQGIGYSELLEVLRGHVQLSDAVERIKLRTRQFAKRQETWFRSLPGLTTVQMTEASDPEERARRIAEVFLKSGEGAV
jgi:tRNA dimethylallyltransferase